MAAAAAMAAMAARAVAEAEAGAEARAETVERAEARAETAGKDWVVEERAAATATAVEEVVEGLGVEGLVEVPCIRA